LQANAPDLLSVDPGTLSLSAEGIEVPISIRSASGGPVGATGLNPADFLEFYGWSKGRPPTQVNFDEADPLVPAIYQANDFTDTQVYCLTTSVAPGTQ